ncbi:MAG: ABC transporter permease [Planctomycetota bacterium]|jgi:ABC-type dipeptide/oligopeptide/nickel transport system permease subunit
MAEVEPRKFAGRSPTQLAIRRVKKNRLAVAGFGVVCVLVLLGLFPGLFAPHDPIEQFRDADSYQVAPFVNPEHPLGTDEIGRDVLSRLIYGAGISLRVGVFGTAVAVFIGVLLGALAGYFSGVTDWVISRITDTFFAIPSLLLAIGILAISEKPKEWIIFSALGLVGWPGVARIVRGQVISLRGSEYVLAAQALGQSSSQVLLRHILPNCMGPIVVLATLMIAGNILGEAGLSFLGIGLPPPAPSWGRMLVDSKELWTIMPWMGILPGLTISITVLGFNLFGDGLRDAFDPKMRA